MSNEVDLRLKVQTEDIYGQINVFALDPSVSEEERATAGVPLLADVLAEAQTENIRRATEAAGLEQLPEGIPIQRVGRDPTAVELERRMAAEESNFWVDSDELTIVWRSDAPAVYVAKGFEMPLWRVPNSNLWSASVRIAEIHKAALGFFIIECDEPGNIMRGFNVVHQMEWRGPDAPNPPDKLDAKVETHELYSEALDMQRTIHVSLPSEPPETILYGTDGRIPAGIVRALEAKRLIPPTALVGVKPAKEGSIARGWEYKYGYGNNLERYSAHRTFFTQEVPAWLAESHGLTFPRERTIIHGASTGGTFAAEIPILDPDKFGGVISLSTGGYLGLEPSWGEYAPPRYALGAGTLEDPQRKTADLENRLGKALAPTRLHEWVGGHDNDRWEEAIPPLLVWIFHD